MLILREYWLSSVNSLVGHWAFEEGSGSEVSDDSIHQNDAYTIGDPSWSTGKVGIYAFVLDGDDYVKVDQASSGLDFAPYSFSVSVFQLGSSAS